MEMGRKSISQYHFPFVANQKVALTNEASCNAFSQGNSSWLIALSIPYNPFAYREIQPVSYRKVLANGKRMSFTSQATVCHWIPLLLGLKCSCEVASGQGYKPVQHYNLHSTSRVDVMRYYLSQFGSNPELSLSSLTFSYRIRKGPF